MVSHLNGPPLCSFSTDGSQIPVNSEKPYAGERQTIAVLLTIGPGASLVIRASDKGTKKISRPLLRWFAFLLKGHFPAHHYLDIVSTKVLERKTIAAEETIGRRALFGLSKTAIWTRPGRKLASALLENTIVTDDD